MNVGPLDLRSATDGLLGRAFRFVIARRWWVLAFYAALCAPATYFALSVKQNNALDRLIMPSDPDLKGARAFEKVFGAGEYVVVLAEAEHPFAAETMARLLEIERALSAIPHLSINSALSTYRRAHPELAATPEGAEAFRKFATGTDLFRKQGLVGDGYLGMPLVLDVRTPEQRNAAIDAIDAALAPFEKRSRP